METLRKWLRTSGRTLFVAAALLVLSGTVEPPSISATPVASAAALPWVNPVPTGTVSDVFRSRNGAHDGIDIAAQYGDDFNAPADLTITGITIGGRYGTLVEATSNSNNDWTFRIAHCTIESVNALFVGQQFGRGMRIAAIGKEGDATGPHVHLELKHKGDLVDPNILLEGGHGPDWVPDPVPSPSHEKTAVDPMIEALRVVLGPLGIPVP